MVCCVGREKKEKGGSQRIGQNGISSSDDPNDCGSTETATSFPPPSPEPEPSITILLTFTSVVYFLLPSLSSHERVWSFPSTYTCLPLDKYSPQVSPSFPKATTLCHSVFSCLLPSLSFQVSEVARLNLATAVPPAVYLTSGSAPSLPSRITLFTPDIFNPSFLSTTPNFNYMLSQTL